MNEDHKPEKISDKDRINYILECLNKENNISPYDWNQYDRYSIRIITYHNETRTCGKPIKVDEIRNGEIPGKTERSKYYAEDPGTGRYYTIISEYHALKRSWLWGSSLEYFFQAGDVQSIQKDEKNYVLTIFI